MSEPSRHVDTLQDVGHPAGYDYDAGSPHLAHPRLRNWVTDSLRALVHEQFARGGRAHVLEIGAGHGAFTDHLLAAGATVTLTEMSPSSFDLLSTRYRDNPAAKVIFDETGQAAAELNEAFDLVVCVSVLHHIPDYLSAIEMWESVTVEGGAFASFQDPLWYPTRSRLNLAADRGAYFAWRARRGNLLAGLKTRVRRVQGKYDESNWRDMVEYHVVRQGCDETAICAQLEQAYRSVELTRYWSTQARALQNLGDRMGLTSTFSVVARGRRHRAI